MTRVLVAGAGGFIGRHVVDYILDATDWEVAALIRGPFPAPRDRVAWWNVSLPATASVGPMRWGSFGEIDYVINLASNANARRCLHDPVWNVENNVGSCQTLLEWARTLPKLKCFIQVSSAEVFGVGEGVMREDSPVRPLSPYAASKAAQDALAYTYRMAYGVPVIVSHTANVFGEGQPAGKFLPAVVDRVLRGERVDVCEGWRRFIHARDCAAAWVWMLENAPPSWTHCNVAGEVETDHAAFVDLILGALKGEPLRDVTLQAMTDVRFGQGGDVVLDGSRLANAGWRHPLGLDKGVERTVAALLLERAR